MADQDCKQISVKQLAQRLADDLTDVQLIDVREPEEVAIAQISAFANLPLSQFKQWGDTITQRFDPQTETLVLCHHGIRSTQMCQWLRSQGFSNVKNVTGGIHAYATQIDRTVSQY